MYFDLEALALKSCSECFLSEKQKWIAPRFSVIKPYSKISVGILVHFYKSYSFISSNTPYKSIYICMSMVSFNQTLDCLRKSPLVRDLPRQPSVWLNENRIISKVYV